MRRRVRFLAVCLLAALLAVGRAAVAQPSLEELLTHAAELSAAGKHADAYALLAAEEDTHIGDIGFDYALGRAALHAGRPDRATLAFSRVLALDPGHAGARIDIGRAFLALGNREQAAAAFEALLALDPPPAVRSQLLVYLAQARADPGRGILRGYLGFTIGTSSNVNQAPGQGDIFVPGLLAVLRLADQNVAKSDSFAGVSGGIEGAKPLSGRYALIGSAEFLSRANAHESEFDVGGLAASLGVGWAGERHIVRTQLQVVRNSLGGDASRDVTALSVEATESAAAPGSPGTLFGFLHAGSYRHPPAELRLFDADFITLGAGAILRADEKSTGSVAVMAGRDSDRGGNPSGDRRGLGMRAAWERVLAPRVRLAGLLGVQNSHYNGFDPAFLTVREDRRLDLEAFVRYQLAPRLEARFGVWRSVQDSNIPIYEYRRTDWTLTLRRQFD
jgi:hypothetical protein